jgi:hypothetical protein
MALQTFLVPFVAIAECSSHPDAATIVQLQKGSLFARGAGNVFMPKKALSKFPSFLVEGYLTFTEELGIFIFG